VRRAAAWLLRAVAVVSLLGLSYLYAVHRFAVRAEGLPTAVAPREASVEGASGAVAWPKQTEEHCGSYALAAAIGLATGGREAPAGEALAPVVSHEVSWSARLSGTLPWRITGVAARRGLLGAAYTARAAPQDRRLDLLKAHIAAGRPTIVLYESERATQHYVVVVGYGPGAVHLYDPNWLPSPQDARRTEDGNGAAPGNVTLGDDLFLARWARGGIAGLYTWWYFPVGVKPEPR